MFVGFRVNGEEREIQKPVNFPRYDNVPGKGPLLEIKSLFAGIDGNQILKGIDLEIGPVISLKEV